MIFPNEKLRKVSDSILQEFESPKDSSKPLEWRQAFNTIELPLHKMKIVTNLKTHDRDWDVHEENQENPTRLIKLDVRTQIAITAKVNEEAMRDRLYCTVSDDSEKQKDVFLVERPHGDIEVRLKSGVARDKSELFPSGVYSGSCFRMNYEPGEDYIGFDMTIPEEQMKILVDSLRADTKASLYVNVELLSFSYEVDDALREPHFRRDLIIHKSPYAFVSNIWTVSEIGDHSLNDSAERDDDLDSGETIEEHQEPSNEEVLLGKQLKALVMLQEPLGKIIFVLWILVIAVASNLFFK